MKKKKLVVAGLTAAMMAASLAGCGSTGSTGSQASKSEGSAAQSSAAGSEAQGEETSKEKARVTFMAIDWNGSPLSGEGSDEVKQAVSDYTNTIIDDDTFTWVASDPLGRSFPVLAG